MGLVICIPKKGKKKNVLSCIINLPLSEQFPGISSSKYIFLELVKLTLTL